MKGNENNDNYIYYKRKRWSWKNDYRLKYWSWISKSRKKSFINPQQTAIHKLNNHTSINNANHKLSQNHTSVTGNHSSHNGIYDNSNGIQRQSEKKNSSASKQFKPDKNNLKNTPEQNQKGK